MEVTILFKIGAVGILVSVLCQILKHSQRDELAFLTSLAGWKKVTDSVEATQVIDCHFLDHCRNCSRRTGVKFVNGERNSVARLPIP